MQNKNDISLINKNIIYLAVVREKHTILSEYTECSGNFSQIINYIMTEIIMKIKDPKIKYKSYFIYGKYIFYILKDQKCYIITMLPYTIYINNDIIYSLLISIYIKLKEKKDISKINKMRPYSLSEFTEELSNQYKLFKNNDEIFDNFLPKLIEFEDFEINTENSNMEIQLPILSNNQVHNYPDIGRESRNTILSYTIDSYKDDILQEKLIEEKNNLEIENEDEIKNNNINNSSVNQSNAVGENDKNNNGKLKCFKITIFILIIIGVLLYLSYLIYKYLI